ncbi:MAG: hypothetical protein H0U92_13430 [Actinobacteria bacterium]|nr:hypothetical protein [Actinomycetota bacterium]
MLTLVQFDTQDAFEVIADAVPIAQTKPLTPDTFQPRGGTPLFDSSAKLILHASARANALADAGDPAEQILFVTFTDGEENQSRSVSRRDLFDLIAVKKEFGWTFAFLGAGMDAYADSTAVGYAHGSVQAFAPDGAGAGEAFASLSRSTASLRDKVRRQEPVAPDQFFEDKAAEADRATRGS